MKDPLSQSLKVRIHVDAPKGTPAIATLIAKVLEDAGATVHTTDSRVDPKNVKNVNLDGLHVCIDRITWVRNEEAERW